MEWTREKTLFLINEYRKRRGLWDMTHDDYRKKEMKTKLLLEVSNSLGCNIPVLEIEKKFHTLRTQYHREINRMKRNEPYNSKWFGFKNLQFLSSPKACRSNNKGRVKEITEDGTVTTKYIIREAAQDNSSNNASEEFLNMRVKPNTTTITYEAVPASSATTVPNNASTASSRTRELEKLIEETTKDVEDIEEAKPKMTIKEITAPLDPHTYGTSSLSNGGEMANSAIDPLQASETKQHLEAEDEHIETLEMQAATDEELNYQSPNAAHATSVLQHNAVHTHHYIKIQQRDKGHEEQYYEETQAAPHIHSVVTANGTAAKRIFYDANGQQHTATILTAPVTTSQPTILSSPTTSKIHQTTIKQMSAVSGQQATQQLKQQPLQISQTQQQQQQPPPQSPRDEFSTYGEYVGNEMRGITNRQILIALKHKINMALYEASMAELQK